MKSKYFISFFLASFLVLNCAYSGSIEDIKNKLNIQQNNGHEQSAKVNEGDRYKIVSARMKQLSGFVWEGAQKYTNCVYTCDVVLKIKKTSPAVKTHCPAVMKVYLFDKNRKLIAVLQRYLVHIGGKYIEGFRDFRVNRTYRLFFLTDFEAYKNTKTFIAVIGTYNEEFVAKVQGRAKIEDLVFEEKQYLNINPQ